MVTSLPAATPPPADPSAYQLAGRSANANLHPPPQHQHAWSRNDIDGITLPMREEKLEMHLQTLLQQTSVAAAAVAAQSFARVAAVYG